MVDKLFFGRVWKKCPTLSVKFITTLSFEINYKWTFFGEVQQKNYCKLRAPAKHLINNLFNL